MSNGTIKDLTPNFKLIIPQFNIATWHDYLEENFRAIDAMFHNLFDIQNYKGVWKTLTTYNSGDVIFVGEDKITNSDGVEVDSINAGRLFKVKVYHTTNTQNTFTTYYNEHPEFYEPLMDITVFEAIKDETVSAKNEAIDAKNAANLSAIDAKNSQIETKNAIDNIKYPIRYQNVTIYSNMWEKTDKYEEYPYEAQLEYPQVTVDFIPTAIFDVDLATSGLFAPVVEAFDGYVSIYAKELITSDVLIQSLILRDTSEKTYEGFVDLSTKADINGDNFTGSGLETKINTNIDEKIEETVTKITNKEQTAETVNLDANTIYTLTINSYVSFVLPTVVDKTLHNQIKVILKVENNVAIDFGTAYYFNKTKPIIEQGFYDVYFDFDNNINAWVCGAISKGVES